MKLVEITRDDFLQHIGEMFRVKFAENRVFELKLEEVSEIKKDSHQESFSIVFLAPADTPTDPLIYEVSHEKLGSFELFLSPFSGDEQRIKFESVFSHMI